MLTQETLYDLFTYQYFVKAQLLSLCDDNKPKRCGAHAPGAAFSAPSSEGNGAPSHDIRAEDGQL
jgi:hypothetical protein